MVSRRYPKGVVEMRLRRVKINLPLWGRGTALAVDEVGDCHSLPSRRFATLLPPEKAIQKHGAPFGAPCGQLLLYSLNCGNDSLTGLEELNNTPLWGRRAKLKSHSPLGRGDRDSGG